MVLDGDMDKIQHLNLCLCTPAPLSDTHCSFAQNTLKKCLLFITQGFLWYCCTVNIIGFLDITHCSVIQTLPLCHSQMSNSHFYPRHETDLALKSLRSVSNYKMMENVQKLRNINSDTKNSHIQIWKMLCFVAVLGDTILYQVLYNSKLEGWKFIIHKRIKE